MPLSRSISLSFLLFALPILGLAAEPRKISRVYPHLTVYNTPLSGECGIGALVPWAGKLWLLTYPPHSEGGSPDKLYSIDPTLERTTYPKSVGGTHAGRMIHRESKQLFIGPYAIRENGEVRNISIEKGKGLYGRLTAVARHLTEPETKVLYYSMEGSVYEVEVESLGVKRLFEKPVPGWHGKGAYTGQGRFVVANNGELPAEGYSYKTLLTGGAAKSPDEMGVLAEWDGQDWRVIHRKQFTEVTGPGGILGAAADSDPIWSLGWDRKSVILAVRDGKEWRNYRLPKANTTYDHRGGWYTEWPRIREVGGGKYLMDMHGMFYDFPAKFSPTSSAGLRPLSSHLMYTVDFCEWEKQLVIAKHDTTILQNPMAGQAQSAPWFGRWDDLAGFGPRSGSGGVWLNESVKSGEKSDPFLWAGFEKRTVHVVHDSKEPLLLRLEVDTGDGKWQEGWDLLVSAASGYSFHALDFKRPAEWVRVSTNRDCKATVWFEMTSERPLPPKNSAQRFAALATLDDKEVTSGIIRPAKHNKSLQYLGEDYRELSETTFEFAKPEEDRSDEVRKVASIAPRFTVDDASVMVVEKNVRYRLPKGSAAYNKPFAFGWPRDFREVVSERSAANIHGTFYLVGRESGLPAIQPICTHNRQIHDFCTWRGLLVITGTRRDAAIGEHFAGDAMAGVWLGMIDDLWQLGKPVGVGGPWKESDVKAGVPSDRYLMMGYDQKTLELTNHGDREAKLTIEIDFDLTGWHRYREETLKPGASLTHEFPAGFNARWVRLKSDTDTKATAIFTYQ